jgi:tetratricopeptide (TPR) repeat protein
VLQQFGWLAYARGAVEEALTYLQQSLEHWRALGVVVGIARCQSDLALFLATSQRRLEAEPVFAEVHAHYQREGDTIGLARSFTDRGASAMLAGDLGAAVPLPRRGVELSRQTGDRLILPAALFYLGTALCFAGDLDGALVSLTESLQLYQEMGNRLVISLDLLAFAAVAHRQGRVDRSARLCGAATSLHAVTGIVLAPGVQALYEQEVALVRAQLDSPAFDAAFAEGAQLTMSEAVELALDAERNR